MPLGAARGLDRRLAVGAVTRAEIQSSLSLGGRRQETLLRRLSATTAAGAASRRLIGYNIIGAG
jgi:hypothetical protein